MVQRKLRSWIGGSLVLGGGAWRLVEKAGDVDFLMGLSAKSPLIQLLARNADYFLIVIGGALLALNIWPHPLEATSRSLREWRRRWKLRHWTDAGLNWFVLPDSHMTRKDGRMAAILAITPVPGSDLPQPLDVIVTCAGKIAHVSSTFYSEASRTGEPHSSGDVVIPAPSGGKTVRLQLLSPKLLPPARWDLTLTSAGNAEIKVVEVKHAPRKGERRAAEPSRPKPLEGPPPSTAP